MNNNNSHRGFTLMTVHAHPDDESISTGGILARYRDQGAETVLVYCTGGEAGDIQDPDFIPYSSGMSMPEIRKYEMEKALQVLRVSAVYHLGYRDSGMQGTPENDHPQSLARAGLEEAAGKLVEIVRKDRPQVMVTYNERGTYGHPDHIMANRITLRAFEAAGDPDFDCPAEPEPWQPSKLYYTAVSKTRLRLMVQLARERGEEPSVNPDLLGTPDEKISAVIDVRQYLGQKFEAMFCHKSQLSPRGFFRQVPDDLKEEAFGYESFEGVKGVLAKDHMETDLFEGLIG